MPFFVTIIQTGDRLTRYKVIPAPSGSLDEGYTEIMPDYSRALGSGVFGSVYGAQTQAVSFVTRGQLPEIMGGVPAASPLAGVRVQIILNDFENFYVIKTGTIVNAADRLNLANEETFFREIYGGIVDLRYLGSTYYLLISKVPGTRLSTYLRGHVLNNCEKLKILLAILAALQKLHQKGIIHGDLHARNILIKVVGEGGDRKYKVHFIDFGFSYRMPGPARYIVDAGYVGHFIPERVLKTVADPIPQADPYHDLYSIAYSLQRSYRFESDLLNSVLGAKISAEDLEHQVIEALCLNEKYYFKFATRTPAEVKAILSINISNELLAGILVKCHIKLQTSLETLMLTNYLLYINKSLVSIRETLKLTVLILVRQQDFLNLC
ncbi:MAG: hypothetical protein A3E87_08085 [Gammaproteobacteria bacterium RIFCSPHIGHO2_12_FULL_35_23]|nr:MAG: hypothetical protein A3E87_08085 [Gammaproteobacteria bacterium RIFCSPHIGHO2_12_FULL_35_23]